MELVDMKLPKEKETSTAPTAVECSKDEGPRYPYGLQLRFENEQVNKIPSLKEYEVGDRVAVQAEAVVTSISASKRNDGSSYYSIELQIESIACTQIVEKPAEQLSPKEYRRMREGK